jgi:hypothetical protein
VKHARPEGIAVLVALEHLGEALGYEVHQEKKVGRTAAVDLSWTAADSNDVPLFVFEVESTASTGIASNALKVFGTPSSEFAKPLFFFHVVLAGRADNERIRNAQRQWGQHNYRVYRFADPREPFNLATDVLRQHRRVRKHLEPLEVARALADPMWGGSQTVIDALSLAEDLRFDAPFLHSYAALGRTNFDFEVQYARRLATFEKLRTEEPIRSIERDTYRGGPGDFLPGLIETAVRVHSGELADKDGPAAFEAWATSADGTWRMIDAAFGLSRDYDGYVLGVAPVDYFMASTLLTSSPRSLDWVVSDWMILVDKERDAGVVADFRLPSVIWLAHLLAALPEWAWAKSALDVDDLYRRLQDHAEGTRGIPREKLLEPPSAFGELSEEIISWTNSEHRSPLPKRRDLHMLVSQHLTAVPAVVINLSAAALCLNALITDEGYTIPTRDVVRILYESGPIAV